MDILPSRAPEHTEAEPPPTAADELPPAAVAPALAYAPPAAYAEPAPAPDMAIPPSYVPVPPSYVPIPDGTPPPIYPPSFVMAPPPATKKGIPTAAKVAIGIVVGFVLVAILAAIAIPVFLNRKPPAVTLLLPRTLQGSTQLTTPAAQQAVSQLRSSVTGNISFTDPQAAIYGRDTTPAFGILAAKLTHIPTTTDSQAFLNGVSGAGSAPMSAEPSGPLGGTTQCGIETTDGTQVALCASIDKSAIVMVLVYSGDLADDAVLAQKLRLAVETH
jgi:hypothetical protein